MAIEKEKSPGINHPANADLKFLVCTTVRRSMKFQPLGCGSLSEQSRILS